MIILKLILIIINYNINKKNCYPTKSHNGLLTQLTCPISLFAPMSLLFCARHKK